MRISGFSLVTWLGASSLTIPIGKYEAGRTTAFMYTHASDFR